MKPKAIFIGRWQPLHNGHLWLFSQKLNKEIPILIMIRDMPPDDKNPLTAEESAACIRKVYQGREDVSVMIIPNIESVNWGRGVGYEVNEFVPPAEIGAISATQIRASIKAQDDGWKKLIDPSIQEDLIALLK